MPSPTSSELADLLSGSWRLDPPAGEADEATLEALLPLLLGAKLAPLGWWKIRHTELGRTQVGRKLQQAFCRQALSTALQEAHIERLILHLRGAGVEPLLLKGWASARLYPHGGLRPLGDIDLLIPAQQMTRAQEALSTLSWDTAWPLIDIKSRFPSLYEREESCLFESGRAAPLRGTWVGVLGPEEHLRMLCLHFLRHGAWRALWLCDIAALVEGRSASFDWDRCLRGSRHAAEWITCALGLAHHLLGADLGDAPIAKRARHLPSWMAPAVLRVWQARRYYEDYQIGPGTALAEAWPHPAPVVSVLRERWPNPIEAALLPRGVLGPVPATSWQILPRQLLSYAVRWARFAAHRGHNASSVDFPRNSGHTKKRH